MAGTINVSRDLWDDPTFKDSEMSQREAWVWMIAGASWKARTKRIGSAELELQRGQMAASTRFMAKAWMWSEPRVRRYLDMLENRRMIRREIDAGVTVITICKYDEYQNVPSNSDAPATQKPTHQRRTSDANYNKGEIREEGNKRDVVVSAQVPDDAELTYREKLLHAAGIDPRKTITPGPKAPGSELDMIEARKWLNDSRFGGEDEIVQMVTSIRSGMRDPPSTLRYFTKPLLALAAAKSASLPASPSEVNHDRKPARDRREAAAADRHQRIILAAATARAPSR